MREKKTTVLGEKREEIKMNREVIMAMLDLDDQTHNEHLYESGILFLTRIYPDGSKYFKRHAESKAFWTWYRLQWCNCQDSFIRRAGTFNRLPTEIVRKMYNQDMYFFVVDSLAIKESFKNYLKLI